VVSVVKLPRFFGYQACGLCSTWIHATYAFSNATGVDLKKLFQYNAGFEVKCIFFKQEFKVKTNQLFNDAGFQIENNSIGN